MSRISRSNRSGSKLIEGKLPSGSLREGSLRGGEGVGLRDGVRRGGAVGLVHFTLRRLRTLVPGSGGSHGGGGKECDEHEKGGVVKKHGCKE